MVATMDSFFAGVVFWHWWAIAAILLTIEIVAPSTFFMWMSMAAAVTGAFLLAFDLSWQIQILIFSSLSILSIISGKLYLKKNPIQSDDPKLNRRGEQHIGKTYTLHTAIENGAGKINVGGSLWRVEGADMPAGEKVTVVSVNGNSFVVEAES